MRRFRYIFVCSLFLTALTGCNKQLMPAEVEVIDPIRHYYPVVQGEQLDINYEIENISDEPLVIQEIQTTCGCLIPADELPIVVLPNKSSRVHLTYDSSKNTGMVQHYVWLYGNFTDSTYRELSFDTNVVPPADYTRDYEELYHEKVMGHRSLHELVNGSASEKGYYTDFGDPRAEEIKERQRKADQYAF